MYNQLVLPSYSWGKSNYQRLTLPDLSIMPNSLIFPAKVPI
jgi:hypothetical protein